MNRPRGAKDVRLRTPPPHPRLTCGEPAGRAVVGIAEETAVRYTARDTWPPERGPGGKARVDLELDAPCGCCVIDSGSARAADVDR
jgi:hypothetical protein